MRDNNCSRCIYADSPCVPSDYGRDEHNNCDHFKSVFEENEELKVQIEKLKSYANVSLPKDTCYKCGKKLSLENRASVILTSNPPKYLCKECVGEKEVEKHKWNNILLGNGADYDKKIAEEYTTLQERIEQLKKQNEELKEQNSKAKDLLKKAIRCTWSIDYFVVDEINKFLKECEK
jgi:hypothetical protein